MIVMVIDYYCYYFLNLKYSLLLCTLSNYMGYASAKNLQNLVTSDSVVAKTKRVTFFLRV